MYFRGGFFPRKRKEIQQHFECRAEAMAQGENVQALMPELSQMPSPVHLPDTCVLTIYKSLLG